MRWRILRVGVSRHRELALAATFVVMAAWELVEIVALEVHHGTVGPLTLALHSAQVAIVAGVTVAVFRAWQASSWMPRRAP
jgi:hypothetical protein